MSDHLTYLPPPPPQSHDGVTFFGSDCAGRQLLVRLVRRTGREAELLLLLQNDGELYQLPGEELIDEYGLM